jgi:hypothetical protein
MEFRLQAEGFKNKKVGGGWDGRAKNTKPRWGFAAKGFCLPWAWDARSLSLMPMVTDIGLQIGPAWRQQAPQILLGGLGESPQAQSRRNTLHSNPTPRVEAVQFNSKVSAMPPTQSHKSNPPVAGTADTLLLRWVWKARR